MGKSNRLLLLLSSAVRVQRLLGLLAAGGHDGRIPWAVTAQPVLEDMYTVPRTMRGGAGSTPGVTRSRNVEHQPSLGP